MAGTATPELVKKIDIQDVMTVVDAIRKQEVQSLAELNANNVPTASNDDPLLPLRQFLKAPGVVEGLTTAFVCIGVMLPVRQLILRFGRQRRLGDLPDLILTPTMVLVTLQASLRVASLTGACTYLERVPLMNENSLECVCSDPVLQKLLDRAPSSLQDVAQPTFWNPEARAVHALQQAISTCKQQQCKD
jgi:hypothetical protein